MADFGASRSVVILAGASGTGKTTFALRLLVNGGYVCRFVFDHDGQAAARLRVPAACSAAECEKALASRWVVYDPNAEFPGRHGEAFAWFCGWAFDAAGRGPGRKILLVDEVWRYCNNWTLPAELAACVQTGRVRELDLAFATQRPNRLNEAISGECTELVCFRLHGERALRVVEGLGADPDLVARLDRGEWVSLDPGTGATLRGRVW